MSAAHHAPGRLLGLTLLLFLLAAAPALADHLQPAGEIARLGYAPEGHFKAGSPVPSADSCASTTDGLMEGKRFNPSGTYNAFDSNVFEVLCLPFRAAGDQSSEDPYGNGGNPEHGFCAQPGVVDPDAPLRAIAGECPNHQLEYVEYFEETMKDILGDFGVSLRRYEFHNPGGGNTLSGRAINPAAIVPGADHPDETIIVSGHFDQTTEGPASAWDSAEGHAQVIRVAKLMADYWRSTGTRPSATVKFIPWDAEESGTLGSKDYAENNIVPGQEDKVRGYWNTDPCAGGYPAFRNGLPGQRINLGIQVARPEEVPGQFQTKHVADFNKKAPKIVEDVFEHIDDTVPTALGEVEVFVSTSEAAAQGKQADNAPGGPVTIGTSRPLLFSSDWVNFLNKGVPFFNPGPEVTGPSDEREPGNPDGIAILHTPNDNIVTLNRLTGPDATGRTFSAGWMKGMEMCAHLLAWGMLREDQGGHQSSSDDVVAYYEALPNEAQATQPVSFDADGSYQYASATGRDKVAAENLAYEWDFGDGTSADGAQVEHRYAKAGVYTSKLTVTNRSTGRSDTMTLPITVKGATLAGPVLAALPAEDADGTFPLTWTFDETAPEGFSRYSVEEARDQRVVLDDPAEDLAAGWTASEPTERSIKPWRHSDANGDSVRGNVSHSGARSFYTGIDKADQMPGVGPNSGVSILTLNAPLTLAADSQLTYWSSFRNDRNDSARVEVAVADGAPLQWKTVDELATTRSYIIPTGAVNDPKTMEQRRADLSAFAGKTVRLRFVYALGASQYVNVLRTGWYVDDIRIDTATFTAIAEPTSKTFTVTKRKPGAYAYRVKALYSDGTVTRASNVETVTVTRARKGGKPGR